MLPQSQQYFLPFFRDSDQLFMDFLFIIGIGQAFFFLLLLLSKGGKQVSDILLAIWIGFIGVHLLFFYFYWSGYAIKYPAWLGLAQPLPLLHGPLLWLYTKSLTTPDFKIKPIYWLHFVPGLSMLLVLTPYFFDSYEVQIAFMQDLQQLDLPWYYSPFIFLTQFSTLGYALYCLWLLRKHKQNIDGWFAYREQVSLDWLRYVLYGFLAVAIIVAVSLQIDRYMEITLPVQREVSIFSAVAIFVLFLGYFGVRQRVIFGGGITVDQEEPPIVEISPPSMPIYEKTGLSPSLAPALKEKLLDYMRENKPFLQPKLSLPDLAEALKLSPNQLSQLINQYSGQNFYQFVNSYRIEEFKQLAKVPENQHLTLLALAYESGFNSKSTFNDVFKKQTGMTPSAYLKSLP